jgi:lipopolysaccharide/colanic/teichoic acid biosynthesis glycosyltransferase
MKGHCEDLLSNAQRRGGEKTHITLIDIVGSLCTFYSDGMGYMILKRMLDIAVSIVVLTLLAPLVVVIAVLVKRDSRGPVLFRHLRVGLSGRKFILYKFRTMYSDAKDRFPELYAYSYSEEELRSLPIKILVGNKRDPNEFNGAVEINSQLVNDPRVTPMGRLLRQTSLDELPNFINVLKGDMHLVGPRPDIAENIEYYSARHLKKLDVRPGITGLAQISGRGKLSFHQTNEYDVEYVNHRSLLLDLKIILRTIVVMIRGEGAF